MDEGSAQQFFGEAYHEVRRSIEMHGMMNSLHEGYAVLLEEVDELWDHVKAKQAARNEDDIYEECMQIAAMACKIATQTQLTREIPDV